MLRNEMQNIYEKTHSSHHYDQHLSLSGIISPTSSIRFNESLKPHSDPLESSNVLFNQVVVLKDYQALSDKSSLHEQSIRVPHQHHSQHCDNRHHQEVKSSCFSSKATISSPVPTHVVGEWILLIRRKKRELDSELGKYHARLDRVAKIAADRKKILTRRHIEASRAQ